MERTRGTAGNSSPRCGSVPDVCRRDQERSSPPVDSRRRCRDLRSSRIAGTRTGLVLSLLVVSRGAVGHGASQWDRRSETTRCRVGCRPVDDCLLSDAWIGADEWSHARGSASLQVASGRRAQRSHTRSGDRRTETAFPDATPNVARGRPL